MNASLSRAVAVPAPFLAAALAALSGAVGVPAAGAAPGPGGIPTLLASAPEDVRFRVPFEAPELVESTGGGVDYRYLSWPGLATGGNPGDPALPVTHVRIAVPREGAVSLDVSFETRGRAGGMRFPPVASWAGDPARRNRWEEYTPHPRATEGAAYARAAPTPFAEIVSDGIERDVRVVTVAVRPVSVTPNALRAEWAASVTVAVAGSGGPAAAPGREQRLRPDAAAEAAWSRTVLNGADAGRLRALVDPPEPGAPGGDGTPAVWFDDAPGWVKIEIDANGMYALSRSRLEAEGVPVSVLDPRTIRILAGPLVPEVGWAALGWDTLDCTSVRSVSKTPHVYERPGFGIGFGEAGALDQVAIRVEGEEDGVFDASDRVVFYGLGPDNYRDRFGLPLDTREDFLENPYTDHTVYWLTWDGSWPEAPLRMDTAAGTPGAGVPITKSRARLHVEENSIGDPSMYVGGYRWERWFWDFLSSDSGVKRFRVDLPGAAAGSFFDARIRLWGSKVPTTFDSGEPSYHHVRVTINGAFAGLHIWGSRSTAESLTPYDVNAVGMPAQRQSDFQFLVPEVPSADSNRLDQVHLTWIDAVYTKELALGGQGGALELDAGAAGRTFRVASPPSAPAVFDVTDARRPVRLAGASVNGGFLEFAMAETEARTVAVASGGGYPTPLSVRRDERPRRTPGGAVSWLRNTTDPLDYVIIAADGLETEAELLADWRRENLYPFTPGRSAHVRVVRVSDIMDEFTWGMWDPSALRYFLEYAFRYYGGDADDPLSYCLFLGDATNDPRDFGGNGVPDLVPSWEDNRDPISSIGFGSVQYVSDDPLARFDGVDSLNCRCLSPSARFCPDVITDLYIGRITATDPASARDLIVNKVIRSEKDPEYGPWRVKAILVADDICQATLIDGLGFTHIRQSESVSLALPPEFEQEKVYLYEYGTACVFPTKPQAKQDLLTSWKAGAWLINYIGHGADVVWADEHVLDLADTPLLANGRRLPVVASFSCSVGKFSNPSRDGLGEAHLRASGGGSLVSLCATHLTSSFGNSIINLRFMDQLFPDGFETPVPAGVAVMEAKRIVTDQATKYVCLGDPASPLGIPGTRMGLTGPPALERGARVEVGVKLPAATAGGGLDAVARDGTVLREPGISIDNYRLPGATLFRGASAVSGDTATVSFTVPVSLRGGDDGKVLVYFADAGGDALGSLVALPVGVGPAVVSSDTTGPRITFSETEGPVRPGQQVTVTLEDPSGINLTQLFDFRSIFLKIVDERGLEQVRLDLTRSFAYETGSSSRGRLSFTVPDLEPELYAFTLSATDNYNNRTQAAVEYVVGELSADATITGVTGAYPNPYDPAQGPLRLLFSLSRTSEVTVHIYTVSGRLVRRETVAGTRGPNAFLWDGRDASLDPVANGVYLVLLSTGEDGPQRHLERLVVLR